MFGRGRQQQFEITEHPDVLKALEAMWAQAYDAGRRDAVAIAKDLRDEARADAVNYGGEYTMALVDLIERLES